MTSASEPFEDALVDFIGRARWFGGKGRPFTVTDVRLVPLREGEPRVSIGLIALSYPSTGSGQAAGTDLYQAPVASYAEPQDHLAHALIAVVDGRHVYDALHDRDATRVWLEAFDEAAAGPSSTPADPGLSFRRAGKHDLDLATQSTLFSGEQSNSSVAFGEDALMKVFRRVTPGVNPDIEIHEALTRSGSHSIAELYGWVELAPAAPEDEPIQLAMLQQFLSKARDGWDLALDSARSGSVFADDARRLGVAVAEVHEVLREEFGAQPLDGTATAAVMRRRLADAGLVVPQLADHTDSLERVFALLADADGEMQRVHGDLHLGQTLLTSSGWKIVDFEGEPAKALAERRLPDSPWRDVAGMLRSFDYAARSVVTDAKIFLGDEWLHRNRTAFLEGYVERRVERGEPALTPAERTIIDAYEADKAVYEVVYEARNRPTWLDIPLHAIDRIGAES